jgi:hypothetical protein
MPTTATFEKTLFAYLTKFPLAENPMIWFDVVGFASLFKYMETSIANGQPLEFQTREGNILDGYIVKMGGQEI